MLVTFTTKAYADITMFGDVAVAMLKMMGYSGTVPSAIRAGRCSRRAEPANSRCQCRKISAATCWQGCG